MATKHDDTAIRIAKQKVGDYNRGQGPDIKTPRQAIEVETEKTVQRRVPSVERISQARLHRRGRRRGHREGLGGDEGHDGRCDGPAGQNREAVDAQVWEVTGPQGAEELVAGETPKGRVRTSSCITAFLCGNRNAFGGAKSRGRRQANGPAMCMRRGSARVEHGALR